MKIKIIPTKPLFAKVMLLSPIETKFVLDSELGRLTILAISDLSEIISTAISLANEAVELIELCGYISPVWRAKVGEVVGYRAKVISAYYLERLAKLLAKN